MTNYSRYLLVAFVLTTACAPMRRPDQRESDAILQMQVEGHGRVDVREYEIQCDCHSCRTKGGVELSEAVVDEFIRRVVDVTKDTPDVSGVKEGRWSWEALQGHELKVGDRINFYLSRFEEVLQSSHCADDIGRTIYARLVWSNRVLYVYSRSSCDKAIWNVAEGGDLYFESSGAVESSYVRLMSELSRVDMLRRNDPLILQQPRLDGAGRHVGK